MKIGDAVRSAVEASNESLTDKLSAIADSFAKLVDASGQGAGKAVGEAMKGAFDTSLSQASDAIGRIATELKDLPTRLSETANSIQNTGALAAQQQDQLAAKIKQGGDDYIKSLASLADQNTQLEKNLATITAQIVSASDSVARANSAVDSNIDKLLAGIGDLTRGSAETIRIVQESQQAIHGMIETLQQQMAQHIQRFNTVDDKLAGIFTSIASHLELQSKQMGEQLTTMDQSLARAVNQFEQLIEDLTEAMLRRQAAE
jgi:hypothetical protein